jgi:TonB family protein
MSGGAWQRWMSVVGLAATIVAGAPAGLMAQATPGPLDPGHFFRDFSESESTAERRDLCIALDMEKAPAYMAYFCQAYEALTSGRDSLAVDLLQEALHEEPRFALGCVAFGDALMERKEWDGAIRWYREASAIAPDRLDPYYSIGRIWLIRAETEGLSADEKALEAFRKMTEASPESPDGWTDVGMVLATLGRFDEARASYQHALDLTPKDPQIYYSIGSLESRRGDDAAAESAWKTALDIQPSFAVVATELAALYGRQGKVEEAVGVLERAVEAAHVGPEAARLRRDLALLNLLQERTTRAESLLEEARTLSPDAPTLAALGHAKMLQGRPADALPLFAEAAAPGDSTVLPFVRAWSAELGPAIEAFRGRDPAGAARLDEILSKEGGPTGLAGAAATQSLVQGILRGWKLPSIPRSPAVAAASPGYDTPPVPIYRALASYPEAATGIEGTITVRVHIDAGGVVHDAKVVNGGGNPALEWAAIDAAKRWRFQPATRNGIPVEADVTIPFRFSSN